MSGMYGGSMSPMGNNRSYDRPYQGGLFTSPSFYNQQEAEETAYLHVPSYSVGAIIGAKGTNIRNIMKFPGASLKIAPEEQPPQDSADSHPARHNNQQNPQEVVPERRVSIVGTPEAQWKAQYLIFDKTRIEYNFGVDDVRLDCEISVPSSQMLPLPPR